MTIPHLIGPKNSNWSDLTEYAWFCQKCSFLCYQIIHISCSLRWEGTCKLHTLWAHIRALESEDRLPDDALHLAQEYHLHWRPVCLSHGAAGSKRHGQNRSFWRLLPSYSAMHSQKCVLILDWNNILVYQVSNSTCYSFPYLFTWLQPPAIKFFNAVHILISFCQQEWDTIHKISKQMTSTAQMSNMNQAHWLVAKKLRICAFVIQSQ